MFKPRIKKGFELVKTMKDLVRGTIYSNLENMTEAYKLFKNTPGVEIIEIKNKIKKLGNITVNFIYEEKFIGEM